MISLSKKASDGSSPVVGGSASTAAKTSIYPGENKQDSTSTVFGVSSMFSVPIDNCSFFKGKQNNVHFKTMRLKEVDRLISSSLNNIDMLY